MRFILLYIIIWTTSATAFGQTYNFDKDQDKILLKAQQIVRPIIGDALLKKYFKIDTVNSRASTTIKYSPDFMNTKRLGEDTAFLVIFQIIKSADTLGFVSLYINKSGKLVYDSKDPLSYSTPELLVGYKRLLLNDFKIGFAKAIDLPKAKGFQGTPILTADTEYDYKQLNKSTYVKVKYMWFVMDLASDKRPVTATLLINASTGKIEKEEYTPRMPN